MLDKSEQTVDCWTDSLLSICVNNMEDVFLTTKQKGNIGESIILSEFVQRGIQVSIPFGDNARYDLIAEFNGRLNKIQIKYCSQKEKNGSIELACSSSKNHTTNKRYDVYVNDVDYMAFYIQSWNKSLLVPIETIGNRKSLRIRQSSCKNNQTKNTHYITEFEFDSVLQLRP